MTNESSKDEVLLGLIKKGDNAAFRSLFDKYYRLLLGTAVNIVRNEDLGKDAVQEVFIQIWKNRETLELRTSLTNYLKRAVINRALNKVNYQKSFAGEEELEHQQSTIPDGVEYIEANELQTAIQKGIDALPERCRIIFIMCRLEGLSHKEISDKLDVSTKTIENQMTKALKALKKVVEDHYGKKSD